MSESEGGPSARQRIVTTARGHFFAHGFRGISMDDLAAELGMSKKTLYAHFPNKTAIVEAAILDKFAELEADLKRVSAGRPADFAETLRLLLATAQGHTAEIQPAFLRDIRRDAPDLFNIVETRRAALVQRYFGDLFAAGQKAGMIRKDVPVKLLVEILLGAIQAVVNPRKLEELGLTPTAGFTAIVKVVLEGVLTPGGRAGR